jgi:FkbM family methyltransferase
MGLISLRFADRDFFLDDLDGSDLVAKEMQQGSYEAPLPMLIMAIIARNPGLFLDVGANNGLYSVLAGITTPETRVVAFEPYQPVLKILKSNMRANGLSDRVDVRSIALSDSKGSATLYLPDQAHGLLETSCSLEPGFKPFHQSIEIEKDTLDNIAPKESISLIKADIEGHELAFLRGARNTITRDRPFIFAEVLPINHDVLAELTVYMQQIGYIDFRLRKEVAIYSENVEHDPLAWNHAFIPRDRLTGFRQACEAHQIALVSCW